MLADDKISVEQNAEIAGALDVFAELDKMPGFVMIHSSRGNSGKPVRTFAHQVDHSHGAGIVIGSKFKSGHVVEEAIQVLPHLGADLLANLARVVASAATAFHNRKQSFRIPHYH